MCVSCFMPKNLGSVGRFFMFFMCVFFFNFFSMKMVVVFTLKTLCSGDKTSIYLVDVME